MKMLHFLLLIFLFSCAEEKAEESEKVKEEVVEKLINFEYEDYTNNPINFQIKGDRKEGFEEVRFYKNSNCKRGDEIFIASSRQIKEGVSLNLGFLIEEGFSEIYYSLYSSVNKVECSLISVINYDNESVSIIPSFSDQDKIIDGQNIKGDEIFLKGTLESLGITKIDKEDFYKLKIYSNEEYLGSILIEDYLNGIYFKIKENILNELKMSFSDLAGNESELSESFSFISDNIKPVAPSVNKYFDNGDIVGRRFIIGGEGIVNPDYNQIKIYLNSEIIAEINPYDYYSQGFSYESLLFGIQRFNVVSVDAVGNESIPSEFFVSVESVIPELPLSIRLQGESIGNNPHPIIQIVGAELNSLIGIYSDPFCSQSLGERVVQNNTERITLDLPTTNLYRFYIKVFKDKFESICLDSFEEYFFDNKPATFPEEINLISPIGEGGKESLFVLNLTGLEVSDYIYFFQEENCSNNFLRKEKIISSSQSFSIELNEGENKLSFYIANEIGNTSNCSNNFEYYKDTTPPSDPVINKVFPEEDVGKSDILNYTFSNIENESFVKLSFDSCQTFYKIEKNITNEEMNLISDGVYSLSIQLEDDYGNISSCITSSLYERDTTAPLNPLSFIISNPIGSISNIKNLTFDISYQENGLVKIYSDNLCLNEIASTSNESIIINDAVELDGIYNYYLTIEDNYGNISECLDYGTTYHYDTTLPDFSIDLLSHNEYIFSENLNNFSFSGICEDSIIINYSIDGDSNQINCTNGLWSLEVDFSSYLDKTIQLVFSQESLAGNLKEIELSLIKDLTAPDFPDAELDPEWDGSISDPLIYFSNIESLSKVYLYNNPNCIGDSVSGVETNGELALRKEDEGAGSYSLAYKVEDFLGNISDCSSNKINFSITNFVYIFYQKVGSIEGIWKRRGSTDILVVEDVSEFVLLDKKIFYVKDNIIYSYDGKDHVNLNLPLSYFDKLQIYNDKIYYACNDPILGVELCSFDKDLTLNYFEEIETGSTDGLAHSSFPYIRAFSDNLILIEHYGYSISNGELSINISDRKFSLMDINNFSYVNSFIPIRSIAAFKNHFFYSTNSFPFSKFYYDLINETQENITFDILIQRFYAPSESLLFGTDLYLYYSKGNGNKEFRRYGISSDQKLFDINYELQIKDILEDGSSFYFSANVSNISDFNLYYFSSGSPHIIIYHSDYLYDINKLNLNEAGNIVFFARHQNEYKFFELNKNNNEIIEISTGYNDSSGKIFEYELRK